MSRLDLPLASFWHAIQHVGHYERDNSMRNMLSGSFHVVAQSNTVYHRVHQGAQIAIETRGLPADESSCPSKLFDKASPRGMPLTAWDVKQLIKLLRNDDEPYYDQVLAYVFLREFFFISNGTWTTSLRRVCSIPDTGQNGYPPLTSGPICQIQESRRESRT
jgi:hypothetical protein